MVKILERVLIGLILAAAAFYAYDYFSLRFRHDQFGSVQVRRFYAILLKGNKIDYEPAGTETDQCVNSVLPHWGDTPCWYLKNHRQKQIDM